MKTLLIILAALAFAGTATAASHDTRLDTVASQIAGHPVVAVCADTNAEWVDWQNIVAGGIELDGFTQVTVGPNIYLAPFICRTLEADLLNGPQAVGNYWLSLAIKTIIHESVHQTGVVDEGVTDCTALTLIQQYAVSAFGYAPTVQVAYLKAKYHRRTKRTAAYTSYVLASKTVPNPQLADLQQWAQAWHNALPAEYHTGPCG